MSEENKAKTCFVIMPISDQPKYPTGHFDKSFTPKDYLNVKNTLIELNDRINALTPNTD